MRKNFQTFCFCQVPRRGWWVTGGMNADERDGISTTDLFNTGEDDSDEVKNKSFIGLILPISAQKYLQPYNGNRPFDLQPLC